MSSSDHPSSDDIETRLDRLEDLVEQQQETIEDQQETIEDQQEIIEEQQEYLDQQTADGSIVSTFSRRSLLQAAGVVGLAGYGTGIATADPQGKIGTSADPLRALYTQQLNGGVTGDQSVTSLLGTGLSVEGESLSAADAASDHTDVADSGSNVVEDADEVDFDARLSATDDGDGTVTVDADTQDLTVQDAGATVNDSTTTIDFDDNLSVVNTVEGEVRVDASGGGSDTRTDVNNGAGTSVSNVSEITFSTNLTLTDDGDGTATVDASGAAAWDDADGDNLLEPSDGTKTGIEKVQTVAGDGSVSVDIDHNNDATGETFTVTHDNGTSLLTVNESGEVDLDAGDLDINGNTITDSGGDVALGSALDANGNNLTDTTANLTLTSSGGSGNVELSGSNLDLGGSNEAVNASRLGMQDTGSDPSPVDGEGKLSVSDGTTSTGTDGDILVASNDTGGGSAKVDVLFEYANGGIPGGSLTSGSVTGTELDTSISPTWTGTHTFDNELEIQEISTPGTTPSAGYNQLYFKSDDNLYKLDSDGNENQVSSGGGSTIDWQKNALTSNTHSESTLRADLDFSNLTKNNTYRFTFYLRFSQSGSADNKEIYWTSGTTTIIDFVEDVEVDDEVDATHGSVIFNASGTDVTININTLNQDLQSNGTANSPGTFTILESLSNHNEVSSF